MENDVSRARAAGFSEHLTKPINFERLEEAIHTLLEVEPALPAICDTLGRPPTSRLSNPDEGS